MTMKLRITLFSLFCFCVTIALRAERVDMIKACGNRREVLEYTADKLYHRPPECQWRRNALLSRRNLSDRKHPYEK